MLITFNLDDRYSVSQTSFVVNKTNEYIPVIDGKVTFDFRGKMVTYSLDWLWRLSRYYVKPYLCILRSLDNILFKSVNPIPQYLSISEVIDGMTMVFTKPIIYREGYRVIPGHTDLAINKSGTIVEIETGNRIPVVRGSFGYLTINYKGVTYRHHRLVALAWVKNNSVFRYQIVNHKNGDKFNNSISNLEWCDIGDNVRHMNKEGLNPQGIMVRMRNFHTGEVKEVNTLGEATRIAGLKSHLRTSVIKQRIPSNLFGDWEIKLAGDTSPWYYEGKDKVEKNGKYVFYVTEEDGTERQFNDTRDLRQFYKLWNVSSSAQTLTTVLKDRRPGISIRYESKGLQKQVTVLDLETGQKKLYNSANEVARELKLSKPNVTNVCLADDNRVVSERYVMKYTMHAKDDDWEPNWNAVRRTISFEMENLETGEVKRFDGLRTAAKELGIPRAIIKTRIKNGNPYNGFIFRAVE